MKPVHDPLLELAVYKSLSGEHDNRSQAETAEILDLTIYKVRQVIAGLAKRCPKLFPMLAKREHEVRELRSGGLNTEAIAAVLGVSERRVQQVYTQLEAKGHPAPRRPQVVRYVPGMDSHIKEKF